jgi:hypothetical protein
MIAHTVVNRPICPVIIRDQNTAMAVCVVGIIAGLFIMYKIMKYFEA